MMVRNNVPFHSQYELFRALSTCHVIKKLYRLKLNSTYRAFLSSLLGLVFIIICVPETKDRQASEIAAFWHKKQDPVSNVTSVVDICNI